ncbi:MAG: hypothetical protein J7M24_08485 [Candidatus Latescibacteria bacterium]|nr:hypothetical protein [Candidatus Latescibacterota bacterium]
MLIFLFFTLSILSHADRAAVQRNRRGLMGYFIDNILWHISETNWDGPAMFVVIVFAILALFRQWHVLLIILLTFALAWGAEDLIIFNIENESRVISVPLLVYSAGGGVVVLLSLLSFFRIAIK